MALSLTVKTHIVLIYLQTTLRKIHLLQHSKNSLHQFPSVGKYFIYTIQYSLLYYCWMIGANISLRVTIFIVRRSKRFKRIRYQLNSEAVAQMYSVKKVLFEISQNSQENIYAKASFLIKLQVRGLQLY